MTEKKPTGLANLTPEQRKTMGRMGGLAISKNRAHMAEIGRKGGLKVSQNREHMAALGRKGGAVIAERFEDKGI